MIGAVKIKARNICAGALLVLLAICGYIGSREVPSQTVSVPVSRVDYVFETEGQQAETDSYAHAKARLAREREQEIKMLERVASDPIAADETCKDALAQIAQITARMETEALALSCLAEMGIEEIACLCSAQGMTLICPAAQLGTEQERMRVIDAVCGVTGYEAGDIKIILAKK